jgi:hypothetical protein
MPHLILTCECLCKSALRFWSRSLRSSNTSVSREIAIEGSVQVTKISSVVGENEVDTQPRMLLELTSESRLTLKFIEILTIFLRAEE